MRPFPHVRYVFAAAAIVASFIAPVAAHAQSTFPTVGARVRVTAPELDLKADAGKLVRATPDSLTVDFPDRESPLAIPIDRLSRLEVSTGRDRVAGIANGAMYGTLVGGLIGAAAFLAAHGCAEYCGLGLFIFGGGGAGVGLIMGSVVGVAQPLDRWEEVDLHRQPNGFAPSAARSVIGVGVTIPF